jgi:SAM-dependent methyltransferase|tara:strand:+ start:186 stop:1556 length:1371 start_codon:yes stop_codon:yes gene_type:complete
MERGKIEREIEYSSKSPSQKHEFSIEDKEKIQLTVPPTVYPPREDTELLYRALQKLRTSGGHLVEIGCGSGAISIAMAIAGWRVSAFDINPLAVAATRGNANLADVDDKITVEEGGVGEENWTLPYDADVVVWNLPYLESNFQDTLGPIEEASLSDEPESGWSRLLLEYAEQHNLNQKVFILLLNTDSNSKNSPLIWTRKGWSTRVLSTQRIGGDTLEVVAFWKPGLGVEETYVDSTESTMEEAKELPLEGWQRIRAGIQLQGRGRRGSIWQSMEGDLTASWTIKDEVINRWTPGLLQVSLGASISEALGIELKWPNDLIYQGRKCGGILLESDTSSNTIRIGIGLNKSKREIDGVLHLGWDQFYPGKTSQEIFQIVDASIASLIDTTPPIPASETSFWKEKCWASLGKNLSRGVLAKFDQENVRIYGLDNKGELQSLSIDKLVKIRDLGSFFISF